MRPLVSKREHATTAGGWSDFFEQVAQSADAFHRLCEPRQL